MKTLLLAFALTFFLVSLSYASPWLACDAYPPTETQPQYFYVTVDSGPSVKVTHTVDPLGWKLLDLAPVSVGQHQAKVQACISTPEWGEACSAEVPFDFVRPAPPKAPVTIKLIK